MPYPSEPTSPEDPSERTHISGIVIAAAGVLGLGLAIGLALAIQGPERFQPLGIKIVEFVVQAVAVTAAGGMLVQAYLKWHARESAINDFRRSLLEGLVKEYMDTKRIRRLLRASSTQDGSGTEENPWTHVSAKDYCEYMKQLNSTQLTLEVLTRRVEIYASVFPDAKLLTSNVKLMCDYLNEAVSEYEHHGSKSEAKSEDVQIRALTSLRGFVLRKRESNFNRFVGPYHAILKALQGGAIRVSL